MSYTKHYKANHNPSGVGEPSMKVTADVDPQALTRLPSFVRSAIVNMEKDDRCFACDLRGVMIISSLNGDVCMNPKRETTVQGASAAYVHLWADNGKYEEEFGDLDQSYALPARAAGVGLKTSSNRTSWVADVTDLPLPFDQYEEENGYNCHRAERLKSAAFQPSQKISMVVAQEDGSHRMMTNRWWASPLQGTNRGFFYASNIQQEQGASRSNSDDTEWYQTFSEDLVNTYERSCEADNAGLGPSVGGTYICISDFPVATMDMDDCKVVSLGEYSKKDLEQFEKMHQDGLHLIYYLPPNEKALLAIYREAKDDPKVTVSGSFSIFCYDAALKTVMRPFYGVGFTTQAVYCPSFSHASPETIRDELEEFANGRPEWLPVPPEPQQWIMVSEDDLLNDGFSERYWYMFRQLNSYGWAGDSHPGNYGIAPNRNSEGELSWSMIPIDFSDHCEGGGEEFSSYDSECSRREGVPFPSILSYV